MSCTQFILLTWNLLDDFPKRKVHGCQGDWGPHLNTGLDTLDSGEFRDVGGWHQHWVQLLLHLHPNTCPTSNIPLLNILEITTSINAQGPTLFFSWQCFLTATVTHSYTKKTKTKSFIVLISYNCENSCSAMLIATLVPWQLNNLSVSTA